MYNLTKLLARPSFPLVFTQLDAKTVRIACIHRHAIFWLVVPVCLCAYVCVSLYDVCIETVAIVFHKCKLLWSHDEVVREMRVDRCVTTWLVRLGYTSAKVEVHARKRNSIPSATPQTEEKKGKEKERTFRGVNAVPGSMVARDVVVNGETS